MKRCRCLGLVPEIDTLLYPVFQGILIFYRMQKLRKNAYLVSHLQVVICVAIRIDSALARSSPMSFDVAAALWQKLWQSLAASLQGGCLFWAIIRQVKWICLPAIYMSCSWSGWQSDNAPHQNHGQDNTSGQHRPASGDVGPVLTRRIVHDWFSCLMNLCILLARPGYYIRLTFWPSVLLIFSPGHELSLSLKPDADKCFLARKGWSINRHVSIRTYIVLLKVLFPSAYSPLASYPPPPFTLVYCILLVLMSKLINVHGCTHAYIDTICQFNDLEWHFVVKYQHTTNHPYMLCFDKLVISPLNECIPLCDGIALSYYFPFYSSSWKYIRWWYMI